LTSFIQQELNQNNSFNFKSYFGWQQSNWLWFDKF